MPVDAKELVSTFAEAVKVGDATVFVGAGLSQGAGLPGWNELIEDARTSANVPDAVKDAPLAAEYIANELDESFLRREILRQIDVPAHPTPVHQIIARLPVRDYWTTNYDHLIEDSLTQARVHYQWVVDERDYSREPSAGTASKRITKMHGSMSPGRVAHRTWRVDPVITRSHFERYEELHPITWTRLKATWLTNSLLFLGLSFDDPNLNLLLRLSRSLPKGVDSPPHFAVLTKVDDEIQSRMQELRVVDLERSGVNVHMIASHDELEPLLHRLEVRCRPSMLFVAGSFRQPDQSGYSEADRERMTVAQVLGSSLASLITSDGLTISSFGGAAGQVVSRQLCATLAANDYRPELVKFYYRKAKSTVEVIPIERRVGTAVFTELEVTEMRSKVFAESRAMVVINGGNTTKEEAFHAREAGVLVVPIGATGGVALDLWQSMDPSELNLTEPDEVLWWQQLNSTVATIPANAAVNLIRRLMFG